MATLVTVTLGILFMDIKTPLNCQVGTAFCVGLRMPSF